MDIERLDNNQGIDPVRKTGTGTRERREKEKEKREKREVNEHEN